MRKRKKMDPGIAAAVAVTGTRYRLAKILGLRPSAVLQWRQIPTKRIIEIEKLTGVPREQLRPDLYRKV